MNYMNTTLKSTLINYKTNVIFVAFLFFMNYMESNRFPLIIIGYYMENNELSSGFFLLGLKVLLYLVFVTFVFDIQFKNILEKGLSISDWKHYLKEFLFLLIYYFSLFIIVVYFNDLVIKNNDLALKSISYQILDDLMILTNYLIISIVFIRIVNNERFEIINLKNFFSRKYFYLIFCMILIKTMLIIYCKYKLMLIYQVDSETSYNLFSFFNSFQYNHDYKIINAGLNSIMILISYCGMVINYKMNQIIK